MFNSLFNQTFTTQYSIFRLQQLRLQVFHNLEVQYLIKQGQVEINPGAGVHNFEKCLLINRNVVESLNKIIQVAKLFE